jgi:hypothetical protein
MASQNLLEPITNRHGKMQIEYLLISIDAEEIVLKNPQPLYDAAAEKLRLSQTIIKNTLAILIPTLASEILAACPPYLSSHEL